MLNEAVTVLAIIRGCFDPDTGIDPGDALHLMWTLSLQIDAQLLDVITQARAAAYTRDRNDERHHAPSPPPARTATPTPTQPKTSSMA